MPEWIEWLARQGGFGIVVAVLLAGIVQGVRYLRTRVHRLDSKEDQREERQDVRHDSLSEQLDALRAQHLRDLSALHEKYGRQIAALQEKRVSEQRLILSAATAQGAVAEVLRDAIQAIQREHDERDREIVAMRAAMIEHHIPLIHVESSARGPSPLRAESVRIVSREDEQGITIIGPQGPISSERTKR
jgi:hypothetical protein